MDNNWMIILNLAIVILSLATAGVYLLGGFLDNNDKEIAIGFISGIVCMISTVFMILGGCMTEKQPWDIPEDPYRTVKIVALNDNNMTNGRFYLRRGYFSEDLYYQYMKKEGSGFKAGKVKASKTTLYYAEDENYRLECYEKTKKWLYFETSEYYYKIYIPQGSIAEDYIVDLE